MDVFDLTAKIKLDSSEFESVLDHASQSANRFGQSSERYDKALKRWNIGAAAATTAIVAFGTASVKTGMKFDSSMSQVAATMGVTVDEIQDLRKYAMDMGAKTAFSATEAADALNYMALAGYDAQTSMNMLPNVLNLAAAGGIDLAYASDMITDSQSALGLSLDETTELVDKMAMAASKSNTSVSQLGEAILTVGGTAKNLSGGTTELATALGILADNGIKGAEGGTALRNIILSLSSPTDQAAQRMEELGLQVFDAEGNMRSLNDIFTDLNGILGTMSQEERMNVLSELFNKVDLKSANALLANTGDRFNELSGYIDNAAGSAEQMANTQLDNLAGDVTLLKSAFEGLQIELSDKMTPVLRIAVQGLTDLISHAGEIAPAILPAVGAFAAFTVAINIGNIIAGVTTALENLWLVLATNPIGLAIALMAGLGIAAYNLITHFGELYTEADKAAEGIRNLNRATESSVSAYAEADKAAGEAVNNIKSKVSQMATETVARMGEGGTEGGNAYKENLLAQLNEIDPQMAALVESTMANSEAIAAQYGTQFGADGDEAVAQYAGAFENGEIESAVDQAMQATVTVAQGAVAAFRGIGETANQNEASGMASTSGIVSGAARTTISNALAQARALTGQARGIGTAISNGIAGGIRAMADNIASSAVSVVNSALAAAKAAAGILSPSKLFRDEVGYYIGLGVAVGIEDSEDEAAKAADELARKVYERSSEWLRRQTKFNKLSLVYQLAYWREIQSQFIKESKQWIDAEEEIFDIREKLADNYRDNVEKIWRNIADIYENYEDKLADRIDQIAGAYGLFDDVQDRYVLNSQDLVTNLQRQVNVMSSFYDELGQLSARGASDEMVQEIREMGPKAVDQLDALLAMTDEQFKRYTKLYGEKQALANKTALKELSKLKDKTAKEIKSQLKELDDLYSENSGELGDTFARSVADGIKAGMGEVAEAAAQMAENANREFYKRLNFLSASDILSSGSTMKTTSFSQSALGGVSAATINTISSTVKSTGGTAQTINLVAPNGDTLAKYVFDPLKNYAASKGQAITAAT